MKHLWSGSLALLLACVLVVEWQQYLTLREMARSALFNHMADPAANELVTGWKSGGILREVRTTRGPGQTDAEFAASHAARVAQKIGEFPIDTE